MTQRFTLNPAVDLLPISPNEIEAVGGHLEGYSLMIEDDTHPGISRAMLEILDGGTTLDELAERLPAEIDITPDELQAMVTDLERHGVILTVDGDCDAIGAWTAFVRFGAVTPASLTREVVVAGDRLATDLALQLTSHGVKATAGDFPTGDELEGFIQIEQAPPDVALDEDGTNVDEVDDPVGDDELGDVDEPKPNVPLLIVATEHQSLARINTLNQQAVKLGVPVLYIQAAGSEYILGPWVKPGASACFWEMEHARQRSLFSFGDHATIAMAADTLSAEISPVVRNLVVAATAPWVIELAITGSSSLAGSILKGRATTGETRRQTVLRLPRCPVCLPSRPLLRNSMI